MPGTTEGGKKAAETRGHESLSDAGKKGGHAGSQIQLSPLLEQGFFKALPGASVYKRRAALLIGEGEETVLNRGQFYQFSYVESDDYVFTLEGYMTADSAEFIHPLDQAKS